MVSNATSEKIVYVSRHNTLENFFLAMRTIDRRMAIKSTLYSVRKILIEHTYVAKLCKKPRTGMENRVSPVDGNTGYIE